MQPEHTHYAQGAPVAGRVLTLDVAAEATLVQEETRRRGVAHGAVSLVKHEDMRVVLLTLDGGAVLKRHEVEASVLLHVQSGAVQVVFDDETLELGPGRLCVLERGVAHELHASEDSVVLLVMGATSVADTLRSVTR